MVAIPNNVSIVECMNTPVVKVLLQVDTSEKMQNGVIRNIETIKMLSRVIFHLLSIKGNSIKDTSLCMLVGIKEKKGMNRC